MNTVGNQDRRRDIDNGTRNIQSDECLQKRFSANRQRLLLQRVRYYYQAQKTDRGDHRHQTGIGVDKTAWFDIGAMPMCVDDHRGADQQNQQHLDLEDARGVDKQQQSRRPRSDAGYPRGLEFDPQQAETAQDRYHNHQQDQESGRLMAY